MALTRLQLQNQAHGSNETFKEYAQCWREMTFRVRPTLSDNELVNSSWVCSKGYIMRTSCTNFADMVTIGERVENGLKSGKTTNTTAPQTTNKRSRRGFTKKKKGEANVLRQVPTLNISFWWPICRIIHICMLPQLNINNLHVSINRKKVINNQHLLREIKTSSTIVTTKDKVEVRITGTVLVIVPRLTRF